MTRFLPSFSSVRVLATGIACFSQMSLLLAASLPVIESESFGYRYDMDFDPTDETAIDLDANGLIDFNPFRDPLHDPIDEELNCPHHPGTDRTAGIRADTNDSIWPTLNVQDDSTVEVVVLLNPLGGNPEGDNGVFGISFSNAVTRENAFLNIHSDRVSWGTGAINLLDGVDHTSGEHVFRVAQEGGGFHVWRDGVLLNPEPLGDAAGGGFTENNLMIGAMGYRHKGNGAVVESLRFETGGSYAPTALVNDPMLAIPSGLAVAEVGAASIALSWNAVAGAEVYRVYRDGQFVGVTGSTAYTDGGLGIGSSHDYQVQPISSAGEGSLSTEVTGTTDPDAPMTGPYTFSISQFDFSGLTDRHVIVDEVPGTYMGQPDTVLLEDGQTIIVAYPEGHGRPNTILRSSSDGGLTWSARLPTPASFTDSHYAPVIGRLVSPLDGRERLLIQVTYHTNSAERYVQQSISEDNGATWSEYAPVFPPEWSDLYGYRGFAPPKTAVRLLNGDYLKMYHDDRADGIKLVQIISSDGGLTWSQPVIISDTSAFPGAAPAEPEIIRSPDGSQLLVVARENSRQYQCLVMTSDDEGATWTPMREGPPSLTGDRHIARYTPDGRLFITIRDRSLLGGASPSYGDFVGWVGTYDDILNSNEGQYRVRLLDNIGGGADTGYSGLEFLPDGILVSTTYCHLADHGSDPVIVSLRFTVEEMDAMFGQADVDDDDDGMLDAWEITHFGATDAINGGALDDWDSDGVDNLSEHLVGTDPTVISVGWQMGIDGVTLPKLGFTAVAGRFYDLEYSDDLGSGLWTPLIRNHTGTGWQELIDPDPIATRFYRVVARRE